MGTPASWATVMERVSAYVWRTIIFILVTVGCSSVALAAQLFKYVDDNGVTVLDDHVPPHFVKNGYTVMDAAGRVLKIIPRALTDQEIAERDERLAREEKVRQEIADREAADAALLRLYSSPSEVERARDTKVASVQGFVNTARVNLQRLLNQKRDLESRIADIERAGDAIPKENLERIAALDGRIRQSQSEIDAKESEMDQLKQDFAADLKRLLELRNFPEEST